MNARILQIRKEQKLTQDAFAEKLKLSKNYVWQMEKGERTPSDRTISDICREFKVNESWLRTGEGEPYQKRTRNQELQAFANDVMEELDESFKKRLILALSKLNESDWETLARIAESLKGGD